MLKFKEEKISIDYEGEDYSFPSPKWCDYKAFCKEKGKASKELDKHMDIIEKHLLKWGCKQELLDKLSNTQVLELMGYIDQLKKS